MGWYLSFVHEGVRRGGKRVVGGVGAKGSGVEMERGFETRELEQGGSQYIHTRVRGGGRERESSGVGGVTVTRQKNKG